MSTRSLVAGTVLALAAGLLTALAPSTATGAGSAAAEPDRPAVAVRPAFKARPIDWGRCREGYLRDAGARCGMLTVPLDHAAPDGPTIRLAVSRVRHRGSTDNGVMLTNPGGPGGSGLYLATYGALVPDRVGRSYDWVGMDPRGVGASRPALSCDKRIVTLGTRPDYDPRRQAILDEWIGISEGYAADCGTSAAARLLPHLRTTDTVADFEVLRKALGAEQVSFYGQSYGTYIAQVYATLHPERIDKLVLDGVVDPRGIWYADQLGQQVGFEKSLRKFRQWVARRHATYGLGRTAAAVERTYYRLLRRLARRPVDGVASPDLADLTLGAGYTVGLWPDTAEMLSELATRGTARIARRTYRSWYPTVEGGDNGYATYLATICTDAQWPTDLDALFADAARLDRRYPFFTWPNTWFNQPCRTWPAPAGTPVEIATSDRDALLVGETLDGATPIAGARELRRRFTGAVLVEGVGGTTHAGSLSGVACVDDRIAAYLADGSLPRRRDGSGADVRCRPVPVPTG